MDIRLKLLAIFSSIGVLILVINLVRRRKLREEYSLLWISFSFFLLIITIWFDITLFVSKILGILNPNNTLFFFGILFLIIICLQFSVKMSELTNKLKILTQENVILKAKIKELLKDFK